MCMRITQKRVKMQYKNDRAKSSSLIVCACVCLYRQCLLGIVRLTFHHILQIYYTASTFFLLNKKTVLAIVCKIEFSQTLVMVIHEDGDCKIIVPCLFFFCYRWWGGVARKNVFPRNFHSNATKIRKFVCKFKKPFYIWNSYTHSGNSLTHSVKLYPPADIYVIMRSLWWMATHTERHRHWWNIVYANGWPFSRSLMRPGRLTTELEVHAIFFK